MRVRKPLTDEQRAAAREAKRKWSERTRKELADLASCKLRVLPHRCLCGRRAVTFRLGDWCCDECMRIEQRNEAREIRRRMFGERDSGIGEYHLAL